jgi:hypothetical protein
MSTTADPDGSDSELSVTPTITFPTHSFNSPPHMRPFPSTNPALTWYSSPPYSNPECSFPLVRAQAAFPNSTNRACTSAARGNLKQ